MRHPSTISRNRRGAALMAVLWLIAILAMACMATLRVISFDMEIASSKVHGSRARQIADMGIALGCHSSINPSDPILRRIDEQTGEGFEVKIISEGGRFNLNALLLQDEKALLRQIFVDWGLKLDEAQEVCDALGDWVDEDDNEALNGAEKKYYEGIGRLNQPFNRPFYNLSEVSLVKGMGLVEAIKPDWREWFTIWSTGQLNLNDAPAELIAAAAEVQVEQADIITEKVRGPDGIRFTTDDSEYTDLGEALATLGIDAQGRPDIAKRFTVDAGTDRIESIGYAEGAKRKITVIVSNRKGRPSLLERTEEIIP